jgi:hypothetical protein
MTTTIGSNLLFGQGLNGATPGFASDTAAVDGDRPPWRRAPQGTIYIYRPTANQVEWHQKIKDGGRNDDWVLFQGIISQRVAYTDFTDGGGATGTKNLNGSIPVGAYFINTLVTDLDDFVGSAVVTFTIGDGTDVDRYNTGTPDAAADGDILDVGVPSGTLLHTAAKTPKITITDDSAFADITAGAMTVTLFYRGVPLG